MLGAVRILFPLPPGAEVSDLGLWFDGHLRHGVAVERVLARLAYEETVHRAVDAVLAEWNAGRAFRFSVYPIPAKGEKKMFIAYDQELTADDYELDLRYGRATSQSTVFGVTGTTNHGRSSSTIPWLRVVATGWGSPSRSRDDRSSEGGQHV